MKNANIVVHKLKVGNKILLETKECVFELEVLDPAAGEIRIVGGRRFVNPTNATLIGVFGRRKADDKDMLLVRHEIEKDFGIELKYADAQGRVSDFVTSPVVSARLYGGDWNFEMWEANENELKLSKSLEEARTRVRAVPERKKQEETNEDSES